MATENNPLREGLSHDQSAPPCAFVIFGGDTDCGRASDAWWYDAETGLWEAIRSTPVGQSCGRFSEECSGLCG